MICLALAIRQPAPGAQHAKAMLAPLLRPEAFMTVCVRLANDVVAEFGSIDDTVEFVRMLGLSNSSESVHCIERVEVQLLNRQHTTSALCDTSAESGIATPAALAALQATSDLAAGSGCRAGVPAIV
jgi:hypothetical protein